MARVFISSTYQDLRSFREAAYVALRRLGHHSEAMEEWAASDESPLAKTLEAVEAANVFFSIIAWKYGYIPEGQPYSITELEWRAARAKGLPCFIFMIPEDAPWPRNQMDADLSNVRRFRERLMEQQVVQSVTAPEQFAVAIAAALHQWIASGAAQPSVAPVPPGLAPEGIATEPLAAEVFLSYAREDVAFAEVLAKRIVAERWSVFWDRQIPVGLTWDDIVEAALDGAKCVVVLWSPAARMSEWVRIEANEGAERKILAPALIQETAIPLRFRLIQAANLIGWIPGVPDTPGMKALVAAIDRCVRAGLTTP